MLLACGERDYAHLTVADVLEEAGLPRGAFHRQFAGLSDCFEAAYDEASERLSREVLSAAASQAAWIDAFRTGLHAFLRFVSENPLRAKALLIDVRSGPRGAWRKHNEVVERFSRAVDSARRETDVHSPPPRTAELIVSAIESIVCMRIAARKTANLDQLLPELVHLGVLFFFGEGPAGEELG